VIKVYVHNTENWIGLVIRFQPDWIELSSGKYFFIEKEWTEIGEL
jgi:hypothetical protein